MFVRRVEVPLLARQVPPGAQTTTWLTTVPLAALGFLLWQVPHAKNPNYIKIPTRYFCVIWTRCIYVCLFFLFFGFQGPPCVLSLDFSAESRKKQKFRRMPSWCKTWCQMSKSPLRQAWVGVVRTPPTVNDCEKARKPREKMGNHDKPPWEIP